MIPKHSPPKFYLEPLTKNAKEYNLDPLLDQTNNIFLGDSALNIRAPFVGFASFNKSKEGYVFHSISPAEVYRKGNIIKLGSRNLISLALQHGDEITIFSARGDQRVKFKYVIRK
jgi:hypothetical protein